MPYKGRITSRGRYGRKAVKQPAGDYLVERETPVKADVTVVSRDVNDDSAISGSDFFISPEDVSVSSGNREPKRVSVSIDYTPSAEARERAELAHQRIGDALERLRRVRI